MTIIKAHFDGKVFIPDEPVTCPEQTPVRVLVPENGQADAPLAPLAELAAQFPDDPDWPSDGAAELDHYLYGTPKRR